MARAEGAEGRRWRAPSAPQTATAGAFGTGEASDDVTAWGQLPALGREQDRPRRATKRRVQEVAPHERRRSEPPRSVHRAVQHAQRTEDTQPLPSAGELCQRRCRHVQVTVDQRRKILPCVAGPAEAASPGAPPLEPARGLGRLLELPRTRCDRSARDERRSGTHAQRVAKASACTTIDGERVARVDRAAKHWADVGGT